MKRVFYLTASDLTVFHWEKDAILDSRRFDMSEEGQSAVFRYLENDAQIPSVVLVDLIEEEFRLETVPHVHARDRRTLTDRKSRQYFRNTPYRLAMPQGRSSKNPKEDNILFAALTNPDALSLLMSWIQVFKVPLQGVYSVPLVTSLLLKRLNINNPHVLLVSQQGVKNLRQSYFQNRDLKTSRLAQVNSHGADTGITSIVQEVNKNQRYLQRLRLLPDNEVLNVVLLCAESNIDHLREHLEDTERWHFRFVDINEIAKAIGLKNRIAETQAEFLYVHLLCRSSLNCNYARPSERQYDYLRRFNASLTAASIVVGIGLLVAAAWHWMDHAELRAQIALENQNTQYLERRLNSATGARPELALDANTLREAVRVGRELQAGKISPQTLFAEISQRLSEHPHVALEALQWRVLSQWPDSDPSVPAKGPADTGPWREITLTAEVTGFKGDYQQAFRQIHALLKSFETSRHYIVVQALKMPIEVNPKLGVIGDSSDSRTIGVARFTIRLIRRHSHAAS